MSAPHSFTEHTATPEACHIEYSSDPSYTVVAMFCGASCVLDDTAYPTPFMDWYLSKDGHKATCAPCLTAWRRTR